MSPLGNVTSSAADRNGKDSNQKRTKQVSLFISSLILSGPMVDIQSWREAVLKFRNARAAVSNGRAIPGIQRLSGAHIAGPVGRASRASRHHSTIRRDEYDRPFLFF